MMIPGLLQIQSVIYEIFIFFAMAEVGISSPSHKADPPFYN
jgi:hypothetical protein